MGFLKCKKCDHVDTQVRFTSRAGRNNLPPVCPRCFNDKHNIVVLGDEISCSGCVYHTLVAGSCSHPENTPESDFWNRPQEICYTSKVAKYNSKQHDQVSSSFENIIAAYSGK